ncbi:restriction endonuclease subunit S [Desulfotignum balticum]|uniref:restriction endonuclease subunit S n=1 Tax=Desulfotignum balticum TaxID=115781 RepID=UPI00146D304B|nr:restriction endonuclease subunit S [Desulfotignum balticum]
MTEIKKLMPGYEAYKDSGVEWIGEIPAHWDKIRLKFSSEMITSNVDKNISNFEIPVKLCNYVDVYKNTYITNHIPFMEVTAAKEEIKRYILQKNDVLITKDSEDWLDIGVPALVTHEEPKLLCGYHLAILRAHHYIIGTFLHWALLAKYNRIQFSTQANGITRFGISQGVIKNIWLVFPTIQEQIFIANFLEHKTRKIDQTVAIKEKQIRLLKERKQILIQNAVTKGLHPDVPMRDSGVEWIGDIPHHWDIVANRTLFNERVEPGKDGLPLLSVSIHSGISDDEVSEEDNVRGRVKIEDKTKYNLVEPNDIVFNMMRAWQGAIGSSRIKGMVSPAYIVAEPKGEIFSPYFEYQYRCPIFIAQMDRFSKGITDFRKRLYWHEFKQLLTVRPPINEQKAIVSHIQAQSGKIDKAVDIQEQMIEKLKEYKATLINSAVTGKIKVPQTGEAKAVV